LINIQSPLAEILKRACTPLELECLRPGSSSMLLRGLALGRNAYLAGAPGVVQTSGVDGNVFERVKRSIS